MIEKNRIPNHVAIVMDGNGRWANKRGLPRLAGHNAGMLAMKEAVKHSASIGVKYLTVYAFSTENWKRSEEEVLGIIKLLIYYVDKKLNELNANNVKVRVIGDYKKLPKEAVNSLDKALKRTENNTGLQFNIALNYGSRDEIINASRLISEQVEKGNIKASEINEEIFSSFLFTGNNFCQIPDPDLTIRQSGEKRLSNFLLFQSAYSEFVFTDVLWPDFSSSEYDKAILEYQKRDRRFGGRINK